MAALGLTETVGRKVAGLTYFFVTLILSCRPLVEQPLAINHNQTSLQILMGNNCRLRFIASHKIWSIKLCQSDSTNTDSGEILTDYLLV